MKLPGKEIFTDQKVLLVGYSRNASSFSKMVYSQFEDAGISVVPYNPKKAEYDIDVVNDLKELKEVPEVAVVVLGKESLANGIDAVLESGVKRVIINSKGAVTEEITQKCNSKGVKLDIYCPLLIVGTGFHKVHKFFATLF